MNNLIAIILVLCMSLGTLTGCDGRRSEVEQPGKDKTGTYEVKDDTATYKGVLAGMIGSVVGGINVIRDAVKEKAGLVDTDEDGDKELENPEIKVNETADTFDKKLISYINNSQKALENYVVSPLSLKMAVSLLAEGADGETLDEIKTALDVKDLDGLRAIAKRYFDAAEKIEALYKEDAEHMNKYMAEYFEEYGEKIGDKPASALMISNSVWKNADEPGTILDTYKDVISEHYHGTSEVVPASEMMDKINTWTNEKTNGMIPSIVDNSVSMMNSVLVNAIYLRDAWLSDFGEYATKTDKFTTIDGEQVDKEFMNQTHKFKFYSDDDTKILIMPTKYAFEVIYVIGDETNIESKIEKAEYEEVMVSIPKMDIESSFDNHFLVDFMKNIGVNKAFNSGVSDFSKMSDVGIFVSDIIQKAKIKTDEDGIEGAAVTAIMMETCGLPVEEPEPKEFKANEPFSFYVRLMSMSDKDNIVKGPIFYGRVVK